MPNIIESRMLFRMNHQPCQGQCYAPEEVLGLKGLGLDVASTAELLDQIIRIHEPACGREQITYALDYSEKDNIYIATFVRFGLVNTYVSTDPVESLNALIDGALQWYALETSQALLLKNPGVGHDACEHGKDKDLRKFALKHSGLSSSEQIQLCN